ncbi:phosphatidylethanolamine-binding protein [Cercophora newfieldiana]|uniref:Phosphatidylethanolamine-binding protein n=1 Tax=Cercophora newfieldiana TaxID=92897 RepID=A0AA39YHK6_9PEZI|nr:phosphatidylethanolamine-binding protein [Cercophora newfieldiana]
MLTVDRLKDAEIIPTVIDDFVPSMFLEARWSSGQAALGNTLEPKKLEDAPSVFLSGHGNRDAQFVITLTDPDAPSRKNPKWSEFCHWIATGIEISGGDADSLTFRLAKSSEVMPYKPPGPPEGTGKHRYVFLALVPQNGTTEKLHLSKPSDRQHWGYCTDEGETRGVREWAKENGLTPVAANFIYAKH